MKRVVAQGTFDILHPGHLHYLEDAASMGEELHVIIARDENVTHKPDPIIDARQRRDMVASLKPVDHARLGHTEDIFIPIRDIDPDVIVLGHDQHHDEAELAVLLENEGIDCDVDRASRCESAREEELLSTGRIIDRVCERRC